MACANFEGFLDDSVVYLLVNFETAAVLARILVATLICSTGLLVNARLEENVTYLQGSKESLMVVYVSSAFQTRPSNPPTRVAPSQCGESTPRHLSAESGEAALFLTEPRHDGTSRTCRHCGKKP